MPGPESESQGKCSTAETHSSPKNLFVKELSIIYNDEEYENMNKNDTPTSLLTDFFFHKMKLFPVFSLQTKLSIRCQSLVSDAKKTKVGKSSYP